MPIATSVFAFAPASALPDSAPSMSTQNATPTASIGTRTIIRKNSRRRLRKLIVLAAESTGVAGRSEQRFWRGRATLGRPGAIAQLGERLDRTQEVGGSSPPSSTRVGTLAQCGGSVVAGSSPAFAADPAPR